MRRFFHRFVSAERGLAFIEFALVAPFILLVLFGGIELTRYMLIVQKVDKTAYAMADLVAQLDPATAQRRDGEIDIDEMNNVVFRQLQALMAPYDASTNGSVIISSIRRERDVTRIKWQIASQSGYTDAETISIVSGLTPAGVNSNAASLRDRAASFTGEEAVQINDMLGYENMIVSEVFFRYSPILANLLGNDTYAFRLTETTLSRRVYSRPRNGNMICLPPTFMYDECTSRNSVPLLGCLTVTGAGSCSSDECGKCRAPNREWCQPAGATMNLVRCVNGAAVNQNVVGGCAGNGTPICP